jgi:hypothetical protein
MEPRTGLTQASGLEVSELKPQESKPPSLPSTILLDIKAAPHAAPETPKASGVVDALKRQFRTVMKALTRAPEQRPQARRRRRTEETGGAFRAAARNIFRRTVKLPALAYAAAFMWDTLDWLNPWQGHDMASANDMDEGFNHTEQNHLSPHP